jgi:pimeloyl-ACP methyl ester carboxylesterase
MTDKPRIGYASLGAPARLHAPVRYLPIIVVPGIVGTRLTDPVTDKLAWNPTGLPFSGAPKAFTVDYDRLTQTTAELVPDETHGWDDDDPRADAVKNIKHYYNLVTDFYGNLAQSLAALDTGKTGDIQLKPKVYCCGYDWRIDAAKGALRLAAVVDEALRETRERKVIIVAHSMGGLVTRYYCRVLGGESRVQKVILIASPTMGAPTAYTQLKHGVPGFYLKDFLQDSSSLDHMAEGIQQAGAVAQMAATAIISVGDKVTKTGPRVGRAFMGLLGDMFVALCIGSGRFLTRKETTYFARQLTGIYQLLPNALYCRDHKNFVIFDPLATGHPPTGFMIVFPTLLDIATAALGGGLDMFSGPTQKIGDKFKSSVNSFLKPEEAERTSKLAHRNMQTLEERLAAIGQAFADKSDFTPVGQNTETGFSKFASNEKMAILMLIELIQRAQKSFVDCTNNRQFYGDIYTGLLDIVEQRALCAANLQLAFRFDDALTLDPRPAIGTTPLGLLEGMIDPVLTAIGGALSTGWSALTKSPAQQEADAAKQKALDQKRAEAEARRPKPRMYMHPNTVSVYCTTEEVESGCVLLPTDILSNDDSNIVRWLLLPSTLLLALPMLAAGADHGAGLASQEFGDGTVPVASANPDPAVLSNPFVATHTVDFVQHADLAASHDTFDFVKEQIQDEIPQFLMT